MSAANFYLAACCIVKDEDPFLDEWFTYHALIGVEHFFVYDNDSRRPLREHALIRLLRERGRLTLHETTGRAAQLKAYGHCLEQHGPACKWLAFIDLDEFLCPLAVNDLRLLLTEYEDYACLALNWKCFGSSGHLRRPAGLVLRNYQERFKRRYVLNFHVKSIAQPDRIACVHNAHAFFPRPGERTVNEHFQSLPPGGALSPVSWDKACVNHYVLKSQQDMEHRIQRGRADLYTDRPTINRDNFYAMLQEEQEKDTAILRFASALERKLRRGYAPPAPEPRAADAQSCVDKASAFALRQELDKAELALCRAVPHFEDSPLIWLSRAFIARKKGALSKAESFIYRALSLGELPQIYLELTRLRLAQGRREEAGEVLFYLRRTPAFKVNEQGFQAELDALERVLS